MEFNALAKLISCKEYTDKDTFKFDLFSAKSSSKNKKEKVEDDEIIEIKRVGVNKMINAFDDVDIEEDNEDLFEMMNRVAEQQ